MKNTNIKIPLIGGVITGIAASACCLGPLILLMLGIGGSWISNLSALEPYRPALIVAAFVCLGLAYRQLYWKKEDDCAEGTVCAAPAVNRNYKVLFWMVAVLVIVGLASPYIAPLFY